MARPAVRGDAGYDAAGRRVPGHTQGLRLVREAERQAAVDPVLPDPRPLSRGLAQTIAEVLAGARPARQLDDLACPDVIRLLCRSAGRLTIQPGVPAPRPIVGSVHVRQPCYGVAEACAVIDLGVRKRAIALRLEAVGRQWRCTALSVG